MPLGAPADEESYHLRQDKQHCPVAGGSITSLFHLSPTRLTDIRLKHLEQANDGHGGEYSLPSFLTRPAQLDIRQINLMRSCVSYHSDDVEHCATSRGIKWLKIENHRKC